MQSNATGAPPGGHCFAHHRDVPASPARMGTPVRETAVADMPTWLDIVLTGHLAVELAGEGPEQTWAAIAHVVRNRVIRDHDIRDHVAREVRAQPPQPTRMAAHRADAARPAPRQETRRGTRYGAGQGTARCAAAAAHDRLPVAGGWAAALADMGCRVGPGTARRWAGRPLSAAHLRALARICRVAAGAEADFTRGATMFHRHDEAPPWAEGAEATALIGSFLFYRAVE